MNISDVAKMAGVSRAAVSRYFNDGYISPEKREAIRQVVEATGFRPSVQAKNLRMKKTNLVGVIVPRMDSYAMSDVVSGIQGKLEDAGYHMMLSITRNDPGKELEHLDLWRDKQVNGVILAGTVITEEHYRVFRQQRIPMVIVGQRPEGCHCVYYDDYRAIYDMTSLLLRKGRTRLAYLGVLREDLAVGENRYRGFCQAVSDAGFPELAVHTVISDFVVDDACQKMEILYGRYPDLDGVVCATDRLAVGAMRCLKSHEIAIPEDVMITGCGDSELARVTTPRLSTIHLAYHDSGEKAAELLVELMHDRDKPVTEIQMDYVILERDSTQTGNEKRGQMDEVL